MRATIVALLILQLDHTVTQRAQQRVLFFMQIKEDT